MAQNELVEKATRLNGLLELIWNRHSQLQHYLQTSLELSGVGHHEEAAAEVKTATAIADAMDKNMTEAIYLFDSVRRDLGLLHGPI